MSGGRRYKCKGCGKGFTAKTNTIFNETDYTWSEMVDVVFSVITKQSIAFVTKNKVLRIRGWALSTDK